MEDPTRRALMGAATVVGLAALASRAKAGPINPPAAPVGSTGHTLDEIYNRIGPDGRTPIPGGSAPVTLSARGSYVLTGNITLGAGAGANGAVIISASDITLDLNGFTISLADSNSVGIAIDNDVSRTTVRNGCITGAGVGVRCFSNGRATTLERLTIDSSRTHGVLLGPGCFGSVVRECVVTFVGVGTTAADNGLAVYGIFAAGSGSRIERCTVADTRNNSTNPFSTISIQASGQGSVVERCLVSNDGLVAGSVGINAGLTGSLYRDNNVYNCTTEYTGVAQNGGGNF
jgi:hypothetical protein